MSIHKVAELAGVSVATVSRVLNSRPRVAAETIENVRNAMAKLGYVPSENRPGPKPASRGRSRGANIAFLVLGTAADRVSPAFQELLYGVSTAASKHSSNLAFSQISDVDSIPGILDQQIDAVLLHGLEPGPALRQRLENLPTVWLMGNQRRSAWGDQVLPDAYSVGEVAAQHLLSRGHRSLCFFNLDGGHWPLRVYGHAFAATAAEADAQCVDLQHPSPAPSDHWQRHSRQAIDDLVNRFVALDPRPTGLFVAEDMQVALLQPALQARGVAIGPGQVEVVSCNNEQPYLVGLMPQPTEIDIRAATIGRAGVDQLLWRLRNPSRDKRVVVAIAPELIASRSEPAATPALSTPAGAPGGANANLSTGRSS